MIRQYSICVSYILTHSTTEIMLSRTIFYFYFFFFFQAEDGIRDIGVTGVQTCALPILDGRGRPGALPGDGGADRLGRAAGGRRHVPVRPAARRRRGPARRAARGARREIGRASCRERV